jgi:glycine/D-amino acid oxidase-like deaminating enzyme
MLAVRFHEHGGPDVLKLEEVATPAPGPGEVLVALRAAALNHLDLFVREGWPGLKLPMPHVGGTDVAGVVTEEGEVRAPVVVCAAGAWSSRLTRTLGLDLPQRWVRGTVARTTPGPPVTACAVWGPGVAFRQRRDGSFTIAAGGALDHDVTLDSLRQVRFFLPNFWKNKAMFRFHVGRPLLGSVAAVLPGSAARRRPLVWDRGIEPPPNAAKVRRSLAELQRVLPSLPSLGIARQWAGYIDAAPDLVPVLGEAPRLRGFVFATGFSGHGFAMGPIAGRLVAELIVDGKTSLDISGFRFSRFAEGAIGKPRNVL